ncbi:MAG: nascent polypeptide-associated complex protein [Nanoarchaeota archaeon]
MFPGMNKKAMEQAMKKLGVKQEEIDAAEVIIKTKSGSDLIIRNPQVMKVNMMGQETIQITGKIEEALPFSEDDINTVMEQTGADKITAIEKLKENNGDLAKTIMDLKAK